MKKIVIINRYYPPDPAISGHSACEMAQELSYREKNLNLMIRYIQAPYAGGRSSKAPVGYLGGMSSIYNGKNKILRFIGNFIEGYRLVRQSLPYADAIITLTDPPMVHFWAGLLCQKKRIPWIYWTLDLYPEAFSSAGIVNDNNLVYQGFQRSIISHPPDFLISLGKQQESFLKKKYKKDIPSTVLPCGIVESQHRSTYPDWWSPKKIVFAYAGNLGEAHDPEFLITLLQHLNPQKHTCLLSLYGIKASHVLTEVKKHPAVRVIDYISQDDLSYIDVHLVSLLPQWTHVCVPSKAVSAICSGRAIAFQGSRQSDTWQMFKSASFHISSSQNQQAMSDDILNMLKTLSDFNNLNKKHTQAIIYREKLLQMKKNAYETIVRFLCKSV
ncbi:MAG: hypothetical protein HQK75_04955 [Candidatus Magnetomorum sp.]|nr:hypothetical protein [Candidatus Magnetomorum sp.]